MDVLTSDNHLVCWSHNQIVESLIRETQLCSEFMGVRAMPRGTAEQIAFAVEDRVNVLGHASVPTSLIRSLVSSVILEYAPSSGNSVEWMAWYSVVTPIGMSVYDAYKTDVGSGFEETDNANLSSNPEKSHKKKADKLSKLQALCLMPHRLSSMHRAGDIHIHDLEYFGTRPFCLPDSEMILVRKGGDRVYMLRPSECNVGDELYTPNGWKRIKFNTVRNYDGPIKTVRSGRGGYVTTTTEHRIPIVGTDTVYKKMCSDVTVGDELMIAGADKICGTDEMSRTTALFLGAFIANGHYRHDANGYYIVISDEDDDTRRIVENFAADRGYHVCVSKPKGKCPQFIMTRKELYHELKDVHKIETGSSNKCLPVDMFNIPIDSQRAVIAGMFLGDGCVHYNEKQSGLSFYYRTVSKTLMQQLCIWLKINGIEHNVSVIEPAVAHIENGTQHEIIGRNVCYNISITRDGLDQLELLGKQRVTADDYLSHVRRCHNKHPSTAVKDTFTEQFSGLVYDFGLDGTDDMNDHLFLAGAGVYVSNCADHDCRYFFYYGLWPSGESTYSSVSKPAQSAEVAILHLVKAMGSAQTNFAGGQGFYNFLTFISPYLEGKTYSEIKQLMQMFVYELMQMYVARGGQVIFSSVQLSPGVPRMWRERPVVARGHVYTNRVYWDFEREVRLAFKALMEVMIEGDANGKPFSFPKPEISIEPCFVDLDSWVKAYDEDNPDLPTYKELYQEAYKLAAKFGTPYFDNQLPEYRNAEKGVSCIQCCAYFFTDDIRSDENFTRKMDFVDGEHFSMGSWQVVSLNCVRAAYRAKHNDGALLDELKRLIDASLDVFAHKRRMMSKVLAANRVPFATQQPTDPNDPTKRAPVLTDLSRYVYTIGLVGINDMVKYHTGHALHEDRSAKKLALKTIIELQQYVAVCSKRDGVTYSLARTPAETTAQRFAVCDILDSRFTDAAKATCHGDVGAAVKALDRTHDLPVYYVNGTHIPPDAPVSLPERLMHEHVFFPFLSGGNIAHIWVGESWSSAKGMGDLIEHICKNTQIGYFAITKDLTVCKNCNHVEGRIVTECPACKSTDVTYLSRITGYLQDVAGWNAGKKAEFKDRVRYNRV